jgi:hypothetical protein
LSNYEFHNLKCPVNKTKRFECRGVVLNGRSHAWERREMYTEPYFQNQQERKKMFGR